MEKQKRAIFILWATDVVGSWLSHCTASRNVAGLIPDELISISVLWCGQTNPSGRTMNLGSTQFLTEMSTSDISWG
jgi:hypothetical protein